MSRMDEPKTMEYKYPGQPKVYNRVCPDCGRCDRCGRRGWDFPSYPWYPYYTYPVIVGDTVPMTTSMPITANVASGAAPSYSVQYV